MKRLALFVITAICLSALLQESVLADVKKGEQLYNQRCASCHGPKGAGDGPIAASIPAANKPRDFTVGDYKVASSKEKFIELLDKGGPAFNLSPLMAKQAGLTDEDKNSLYEFVASLKTAS